MDGHSYVMDNGKGPAGSENSPPGLGDSTEASERNPNPILAPLPLPRNSAPHPADCFDH